MFLPPLTRCLCTLALLVATSVPAFAYVVDFEAAFDIVPDGATYTEQGIGFTPAGGDAMIAPSFCDPVSEVCATGNNTSYLTALNGAEITVARTDGLAFDLLSFDASFVPTQGVTISSDPIWLQLTGTVFGGGSVFQTFNLLADGSSGNFLFDSYNSPTMRQLSSVTFSACFFDGSICSRDGDLLNLAQFALDNLSFDNPSSVPEPGMVLLMAMGLGALAYTRRRSVQS